MNKLLLTLLVCGALACSKKTPAPTVQCDSGVSCPAPKPIEITDVIAEDNWQFTLTGSGWEPVKSPIDDIVVIFRNTPKGAMLLLDKAQTDYSYTEYVIDSMRGLVEAGATVVSAKQAKINDTKFVLVQVSQKDESIWVWITVKDGYGYSFSCGGEIDPDAGSSTHDLCEGVAQSLIIK